MEKLCLFFQSPGEHTPEPVGSSIPLVFMYLYYLSKGCSQAESSAHAACTSDNAAISVSLSNASWSPDTV